MKHTAEEIREARKHLVDGETLTDEEVIHEIDLLHEMQEAEIADLTDELSQMDDAELEAVIERASVQTTKSRIAGEILNEHRSKAISVELHPAHIQANQLPIYERVVKRYPHLAFVKDAKHFCSALCRLAAVPGVSVRDYFKIGAVANGEMWPEG